MRRSLPAILWSIGMLVACVLPGEYVPDVPILSIDKLVHVGLFAVFGVLWLHAVPAHRRAVVLWGLAFAVGIEVLQEVLPVHRSGDAFDALADALGLALAVAIDVLRRRSATSAPDRP